MCEFCSPQHDDCAVCHSHDDAPKPRKRPSRVPGREIYPPPPLGLSWGDIASGAIVGLLGGLAALVLFLAIAR